MKIVQILRCKPDAMTEIFVDSLSKDNETTEVLLYEDAVDYNRLIDEIFEADRVVCWW